MLPTVESAAGEIPQCDDLIIPAHQLVIFGTLAQAEEDEDVPLDIGAGVALALCAEICACVAITESYDPDDVLEALRRDPAAAPVYQGGAVDQEIVDGCVELALSRIVDTNQCFDLGAPFYEEAPELAVLDLVRQVAEMRVGGKETCAAEALNVAMAAAEALGRTPKIVRCPTWGPVHALLAVCYPAAGKTEDPPLPGPRLTARETAILGTLLTQV
jgi:hypothetical protein